MVLKSKLGKEKVFEDETSKGDGEPFTFISKENDVPSCFYGAVLQNQLG